MYCDSWLLHMSACSLEARTSNGFVVSKEVILPVFYVDLSDVIASLLDARSEPLPPFTLLHSFKSKKVVIIF